MSGAYYNDNDEFVCAWLRNLIAANLIAPGDVDKRDIKDVQPDDLRGYTQCHFFAGIGGWSYALRLAGITDDRPLWTASCPCPPFSVAGKRQKCPKCESGLLVWCPRRTGYAICADCQHAWLADSRHLWPEIWRLAAVRRPERIFGEQVASIEAIDWLAGVRGSLEIIGYNLGAAALCSCGVGAPNIRQRNFWVADRQGGGCREECQDNSRRYSRNSTEGISSGFEFGGNDSWMANSQCHAGEPGRTPKQPSGSHEPQEAGTCAESGRCGDTGGLADADGGQSGNGHLQRGGKHGLRPEDGSAGQRLGEPNRSRLAVRVGIGGIQREALGTHERQTPECGSHASFWDQSIWIECADGKCRRIPADQEGNPEPSLFPMATGVPNRLGTLRGSGNAINPEIAAEFIRAYQEIDGVAP